VRLVYIFENQRKPMRISLLCVAIAIATFETMTPAYAELGGAVRRAGRRVAQIT